MPSYLVTGGSGQLGKCFQAVAKEFSEIQLYFVSRSKVNITQVETINSFYKEYPFDGIINCAAYTDVDQAEREEEKPLSSESMRDTGRRKNPLSAGARYAKESYETQN